MSQISKGSGGGNGDGNLFYDGDPSIIGGSTNIPIESLRMKHIRDGIEDYGYLALLRERAGADGGIWTAKGHG